jgi:hypothetical protein
VRRRLLKVGFQFARRMKFFFFPWQMVARELLKQLLKVAMDLLD